MDLSPDDVIDAWRDAGRSVDRSLLIHPTGRDERDYRASGRAAALDLVRTISDHADAEPLIVVDYGCGDGRVAHELARLEPAWQVVGLDASPEMVDAFAARGDTIGSDAVASVWHTAMGPPPLNGVDVAYSLAVFIHHDHEAGAAMLAGLASIVRRGGLVLVDAPVYDVVRVRQNAHDVTTWTGEGLRDAADCAGLDVVVVEANPGEFDWTVGPGPAHGKVHVLMRR